MRKKLVNIGIIISFFVLMPLGNIFGKNDSADGVINHVITNQKIVAITFDADMTLKMLNDLRAGKVRGWYNEKVIKTLNERKIPATLFLTGLWIETYPNQTIKLSQNPLFEIANHSYSHRGFTNNCFNLGAVPLNQRVEEIIKTDKLLSKYAKSYKKFFRFPGLCSNASDIMIAKKLGYISIGGTISGFDAFENNPQKIIRNIVSQVKPGDIIVLHMNGNKNSPATDIALPKIIQNLQEKKYKFVKISELLKSRGLSL